MTQDRASGMDAWLDLAREWQDAAGRAAAWWTHAGAALRPGSLGAAPPAGPELAAHAAAQAALDARFRPRFEALWQAASAALADPTGAAVLPSIVEPAAGDRRFAAPEWRTLPYFALLKQHYLLAAEYLQELAAISPLPGPEKRRASFLTRQVIDALAPTNFPATNPEVWKKALASEGRSLLLGLEHLLADARKGRISMTDEAAFTVGGNLAITPGDVVYRNDLFELIQYGATTARVHRRPLVIVPPCINKYYILDLKPDNSFVRWVVGQGHTVFMMSWRNIPPGLGHLDWEDYVGRGVLEALAVAKRITRTRSVNTLGFCVGGAILACALAILAARGDRSVASATLLTTMLDYEDPGEIAVYVSRELLAAREPALMAGERIRGSELAAAFASLRANELVWNYVVNNYLKGEVPPAFDLLYWNSDSSNLPGPMYVYYLRNMYLDNRLREPGALRLLGKKLDLRRMDMPVYIYASREDHIVPWHSAYRSTGLVGGAPVFTLGASGHIAGVVNPPAPQRRGYWTNDEVPVDPEAWLAGAQQHPGSWWAHWGAWLARQGGAMRAAPRATGSDKYPAVDTAPGRYVLEPMT